MFVCVCVVRRTPDDGNYRERRLRLIQKETRTVTPTPDLYMQCSVSQSGLRCHCRDVVVVIT